MRATVGSLPPAVYWRRRAVVLGALLLVVIVSFVACSGGDDDKKRGAKGTGASQFPTPAPEGSEPEEEPSFSDALPGGGPSLPAPEDLKSPAAPNGAPGTNPSQPSTTGNNANVTAQNGQACSDQEISVTPLPATNSVKRGATLLIRLKIKNISARTCTRDLGAGAQELYIDQGARKFWSSDTCSTDRSVNQVKMGAGIEYEYRGTWNGRQTTKCEAGMAGGQALPPGNYEIRARLGTKVSDPVALAVTA